MESKSKPVLPELEARLQCFLDGLCFLIDFEPSGTTVPSIIAEDKVSTLYYWVVANNGIKPKAIEHLNYIMNKLRETTTMPVVQRREAVNDIITSSIQRSPERVEKYRKELRRWYGIACKVPTSTLVPGIDLVHEAVAELVAGPKNHVDFCKNAYDLRSSRAMTVLHKICRSDIAWSSIQHFIMRLGWWQKSANAVFAFANMCPQAVSSFEIHQIPDDFIKMFHARPQIRPVALENIMKSIKQCFKFNADERKLEMLKVMDGLESERTTEEFLPRMQRVLANAKFHAEIIAAEYAHSKKLNFFMDYKYIGCSKRSCYLCDRYLQCHPCAFVSRPCHNNVWPNWLAPKPVDERDPEVLAKFNERLTRVTQIIIMDVQDQLVMKRPWEGRRPDSTTGTITSVPVSSLTQHN